MPDSEPFPSPPVASITLLDILSILARRKWLIVLLTMLVAVLTATVALLGKVLPPDHPLNFLPDVYEPQVDVLIQEGSRSSDTLGSLLNQSGLGSLSGLLGSATSTGGGSADLALYLLGNNLMRDSIAKQFDFAARYGLVDLAKTRARSRVAASLEFEFNAAPGVLSVRYRDTDKVFATEVVNWTVSRLSKQFEELTTARAEEKRADLEARLEISEEEMDAAKQALIDYSVKHQIVDISTQASAAAGRLEEYRSRRTALQLELNNQIKAGRNAEDPQVVRIQDDIGELDRLIGQAESGWTTYRPTSIPEQQWPRIASEYLDLKDKVTVRQGVYTLLLQSYEKVRLEEQDKTSVFHVLQYADVPEVKSAPSRAKICVIATVAGFLMAVLLAFVAEYLSRARQDPDESRKLEVIRDHLRLRRRRPPQTPERY